MPKKPAIPWQRALQAIIDANNKKRLDGKVSSNRTQEERAEVIFRGFETLRELGYKLHNPSNFKPKHMQVLGYYWEEKGLSPATIQNAISIFRVFAEWIGKPGMIGPSENYVRNPDSVKRTYAAQEDKSWTARDVDPLAIIQQIAQEDPYVGIQLKVIHAFGLRRKEGVMFHPFLADKGDYLIVTEGTKGNRARHVLVDTPYKRQVLEEAKTFVRINSRKGIGGHIGDPKKTLEQNLDRYSNVMTRFGITKKFFGTTGHGLRAQFACDRLEDRGVTAPVRGGVKGQAPTEIEERAYLETSEELGHSRKSVIAAYAGAVIVVDKETGEPVSSPAPNDHKKEDN